MRINGRSALACKENIGSEINRFKAGLTENSNGSSSSQSSDLGIPVITIAPMGNMPVIKDLVVDMTSFWDNLRAIVPYVNSSSISNSVDTPDREFLQTPEERARLNQPGNCILCGACYSDCNAREVDSTFVGPHALAKAYRMVADPRDQATEERLEQYNQGTFGVWGCTRCYYCNSVCPMGVAPLDQIGKIKSQILDRKTSQDSRSIRHRKVLIELVKQGGWIDERLFGLRVVGNSFRDVRGLLSLGPLGLRMVIRRKFPQRFEPSEGTATVRSLIESVQQLDRTAQFEPPTETPEPVGG